MLIAVVGRPHRATLLVRVGCTRKSAVLRQLPDGSYLSYLAGLHVRIIKPS